MKNSKNNNNKAGAKELESELQKVTQRLNNLELYYQQETDKLKLEINNIQKKIDESTSSEVNGAHEEIHTVVEERILKRVVQDPDLAIEVGDVVQIQNNWRGLRNVVGVVDEVNKNWVWILDHVPNSKRIQRGISNIKIVTRPYDYGFYQDEWNQWVYTGKGKAAKGGEVKNF